MGLFGRKKKKQPDPTDDDDVPGFPPPSQEAVAWRALCLAAMSWRGIVEYMAAEGVRVGVPQDVHQKPLDSVVNWVKREQVDRQLSPEERNVVFVPLLALTRQQMLDAHWRHEAFGTVCWALSLVEKMPPWDQSFHSRPELFKETGVKGPAKEFIEKVRLRSREEVTRMQETAKAWNWRARTTRLIRENHPLPPEMTWDEVIRFSSHGYHGHGMIPPPIRDDFPVLNKAYRELTDGEYQEILSIAQERHFAMNWLCGYSEDWDSTPTGT